FNKQKFAKFSDEQKNLIELCSNEMHSHMTTKFQYENAKALSIVESSGVTIREFPKEIMQEAQKAMLEVVKEKSTKSEDFKKVWKDAKEFLDQTRKWTKIGIKPYLDTRDS
ncbi:MAG TPA: C4-dicarboxylate ABC transporter, partial [Campylobacterales bacterium]|nr:C4-dicarboxylate ABC transporter [Campylobacterales bacterium]